MDFKNKQKNTLNDAAKNNPKKFWDLIKKYKNKTKNESNITADDFFQYFKDIFENEDSFKSENVEDFLNNNDNTHNVESLDSNFNEDEVLKAIQHLKRHKSPGDDLLVPEIFIEGSELLTPMLCKLFNFIFNQIIYPESWTKGILIPVPKKGDKNNVDNYRGIMLTSIFSKIFSQLLNNRLTKWSEDNNILSDNQFGFRQHRSTIDCVFVLQSIINKIIKCERRKLYCAFVDFKKAFDLVYRNGIWFKLFKMNVSSKFINIVQAIYKSVKSCVRVNGNLTEYFDSYMGVKQGETLSPLLFIMFINDMTAYVNGDNIEAITIDELQIYLLLFADDTVLFSYSSGGLQILLNKLHEYCNEWNITVNTNKTVVMVCKQGTRVENVDLYYNNTKLENVSKFTYLERLYDQHLQGWYGLLNSSPKLKTYNYIKSSYGLEKYLNCVKNNKHRVALTRLTCSAHKLAIEEGRYRNIERAERKCLFCSMNSIENEYHFILVCPSYLEIRRNILPSYYCRWPTKQKLKSLLSSDNSSLLNKLAKYVYMANEKRESMIAS